MKQETEHPAHSGIVKERDALKEENDALRAELTLKQQRIVELERIIAGVANAHVQQS